MKQVDCAWHTLNDPRVKGEEVEQTAEAYPKMMLRLGDGVSEAEDDVPGQPLVGGYFRHTVVVQVVVHVGEDDGVGIGVGGSRVDACCTS